MIPIKNIYYMLAYAFRILDEKGYKKLETEQFENTADICAGILIKAVSKQLKLGLEKEYIPQKEAVSILCGKLDITSSIKEMTILKRQMICDYDEFSINCYMNRIIKSTMSLLIKSDISKTRKKELKKLMIYFSEVDLMDIHRIDWGIRYHRNNQNYCMMMGICRLVIQGLLQTEDQGTTKLMKFLDEQNMCKLYERFILEYYKKEFKILEVNAAHIKWNLDDGLDVMLPIMKSDITLKCKKQILIIDAKYYTHTLQSLYDVSTIRSAHLYQIFTYVKNMAANCKKDKINVSGMLLYAKTDEDISIPKCSYKMSGNKIEVKTLDLNCDFNEIKKQLDQIVKENFET